MPLPDKMSLQRPLLKQKNKQDFITEYEGS